LKKKRKKKRHFLETSKKGYNKIYEYPKKKRKNATEISEECRHNSKKNEWGNLKKKEKVIGTTLRVKGIPRKKI
jgi:hypothetical protein